MYDVAQCKKAVEYLAKEKENKFCKLLLRKWRIFKELILVLQIPYKATISLQSRSLTLSDAYGIWYKMSILLNTPDMLKMCRTNFRQCLLDALNSRRENTCDMPIMWSALYLDPRYHQQISSKPEKRSEAIRLLKNLWDKIQFIRNNDERYMHTENNS